MKPLRIRVGVRCYPDGWNVVVEMNGKQKVYDPTYATEAEAVAKAEEVGRKLRAVDIVKASKR